MRAIRSGPAGICIHEARSLTACVARSLPAVGNRHNARSVLGTHRDEEHKKPMFMAGHVVA